MLDDIHKLFLNAKFKKKYLETKLRKLSYHSLVVLKSFNPLFFSNPEYLLVLKNLIKDLWTGDVVDSAVVGGEDWEGGDYQGILPPHANWAFKLTPV